MLTIRNLIILLAIATAFPAWATPPSAARHCGPELSSETPLTAEQATEIIGEGEFFVAAPQLKRALQFIVKRESNFERRVEDLETLFYAIRNAQILFWNFTKFSGPDGSIGFTGDLGHFVLVKRDGRLFRGKLDIERINHRGVWNGKFEEMHEVVPQ